LITPLPMMIRPPQSPACRCPTGRDEVKTIGSAAVPLATMRAPRVMKSDEPTVAKSPWMTVPGWMVSVAPLVTWMKPCSV